MKNQAYAAGIFLAAAGYTVYRYVLLQEVDTAHLPGYLANKAMAFASVVYLFICVYSYARGARASGLFWGTACRDFAFLHVILSLALLRPSTYPDIFQYTVLDLRGELLILFGAVALLMLWKVHQAQESSRTIILLLCAVTGLHVLTLGVVDWLDVSTWFLYPPGISLLAFIVCVASLLVATRKP